MTQDVLITITGLHFMENEDNSNAENEPIEIISPGKYYEKNGKVYVLYEEIMEGFTGSVKNKVKITGDSVVEIIKTGITSAHMIFENGKSNVTYYSTPFGQLHVELHTRNLDVKKAEDQIDIDIDYRMDVNGEPAADCRIVMAIKSKIKK